MPFQTTLLHEVTFEGIGLHTGSYSRVRLKPAKKDTGIVFLRIDKKRAIKASVGSVIDTAFSTTLGHNGVRVRTVEHLLAALSGLGIDNLIIEVNGPEIPILDGSAIELVSLIRKGGIVQQDKKRPCIRITRPVAITDGQADIAAFPSDGKWITFRIHFKHQLLGEQRLSLEITEKNFIKDIASARTFGFLRDVKYLKTNGHAKGGSCENAIILDRNSILNSSGLRFKDEFVRHKILDLMGDFSLIGLPLYGHIVASKAGHTTNLKFLKKLLSYQDCWEMISEMPQTSPVST